MNSRIIFGSFFILTYGIHVSRAAFLNLGTEELLILLVVGLLFFAFFIGIFVLIYSLVKKSKSAPLTAMPNTVSINFGQSVNHRTSTLEKTPKTEFPKLYSKVGLPQQNEIRYVNHQEIIRCESDNNYTNFFLNDGEKILISKPLKEYSDLLKPQGFVRAHQSHLVNPKFVKSWLKEDGGTLLMTNGDKIPVSKPNRDAVKGVLGK
ncbi:LytR/AlgR family response regulator transcription factor [Pedobacter sandarakinus]|uniref:LytR/AlgR family response regulator transcription factor n=1 Tax=Pedobacter sandarakinus TaxID=353156 RepID=UPI0022464C2B|nr:LytTR family DNA-binding domain-containing protein [Pedobacter sandarakinus]MCX2573875.1 LytTR family DNA-binding domain-containing protein [Pedobacter sandarakinus]